MPVFIPLHRLFWLIKIRKFLYWLFLKFGWVFFNFITIIILLLLVCCISFCFSKTFIGEGFELPMSHVSAMGSGSAELWEPSLRVCALFMSHDKDCWWVTQISMDFLGAGSAKGGQPQCRSRLSSMRCWLQKMCALTLMNSALFLSLLEPSEVSITDCNKIIYAKPKLRSTDPWTISQLREMSELERGTALWMQLAVSWR